MFKRFIRIFYTVIFIISILFSFLSKSSSSPKLTFPIRSSYSISSYYGYRTLGSYHMHNGIDIPLTPSTPVYALSNGTISYIGFSSSYGNMIIISYYNGYKSLYGHMSDSFPLSIGDTVSSSDIVAYVGPKYLSSGKLNGFTTGPHLHFSLYKGSETINPLLLFS